MSVTKETDVKEQVQVEEAVDEKGNVDVSESPKPGEQNELQTMPTPEEEVISLSSFYCRFFILTVA